MSAAPSRPPDPLVARLRAGDQDAFREVVRAHNASLLRIAATFVPSRAVAEEVVQDTWIAAIKGIDRFEERSSLRTWLVRIAVNIARTRGVKERRTVPMSSLERDDSGPAVDPSRFSGPPERGSWSVTPSVWSDSPEAVATSRETLAFVLKTVQRLPDKQRQVVMLRDVEGWPSSDVRELLDLSEGNQRILLHRGRAVLRNALELHLGDAR